MNAHDLIIGGLRIGFDAGYGLIQDYETIGGSSVLRMLDGTGIKQTHWQKLRTRISGRGRYPPGLDGLDYSTSMQIACAAPRSLTSASNVFTLPAARRSDWPPAGYAIVDGRVIRVAVSVVSNTATVATTAGADAYQVIYWPMLTVLASPPQITFDARNPAQSIWSLEAEEA